ncbi:MAG TPA: hypothetical protein VFP05_04300 [Thermomicrobiales bacterium]|nr:hypothetical protein [Thermomicrobiales bacterium]
MDGTRFDELTRRFGAGLSRRQVLRGLLGGAGALAVTGATRQFAGAQACEARVDCDNVQQPTCPDVCPEGSQPGNNRGLDGTCCTGNGTCCSNNCVDGVCVGGLVPICAEVGESCAEVDCCNGLACQVADSTCVEQECQEAGDICEFDENCCGDLLCVGSLCTPPDGECAELGEICEVSDDCCDELVCVDYFCAIPDGECIGLGEICEVSAECCDELVCVDYFCGYKLPNTGAGDGSSGSSSLVTTAIAGGAAALVAAKVLRRKPADETSTEV